MFIYIYIYKVIISTILSHRCGIACNNLDMFYYNNDFVCHSLHLLKHAICIYFAVLVFHSILICSV